MGVDLDNAFGITVDSLSRPARGYQPNTPAAAIAPQQAQNQRLSAAANDVQAVKK